MADLRTARDLVPNNSFTWPPLVAVTYVEVRDFNLTPDFGEGASTGSGVPLGTDAQRSGFVFLALEAVV